MAGRTLLLIAALLLLCVIALVSAMQMRDCLAEGFSTGTCLAMDYSRDSTLLKGD